MFWTTFIFTAGLIVGWNVLPQPRWVRRLYANVATWIAYKFG